MLTNELSEQPISVTPLPAIAQLLSDSFALFKKSFLSLFIFTVISWVAIVLLVFVVFAGLIPVGIFGFMQANSHTALSTVSAVQPITIVAGAILFFLLILGIVLISAIMQISFVLVLDGKSDAFAFGAILKKSVRLVIPVGFVLLYVSFITTGAFFLFVLPGILFSILLSFSLYEVILEEKRGNEALRRSIGIVSSHFWGIILRAICLWLITLAVVYLAPLILVQVFPKQQLVIGSISYFINSFFAWYSLSYNITLYKQALASIPPTKVSSVKWFYLIAVVGWIFSIVIGISLVYMVTQFISSAKNQLFLQQQIEEQLKKSGLLPKVNSGSTIYNYNEMKEFK